MNKKQKTPLGRRYLAITTGILIRGKKDLAVCGVHVEKFWEGVKLTSNRKFSDTTIAIGESDREFAKTFPLGTRMQLTIGGCVSPGKLSFEYCRLQVLSQKKKADALMGSRKTNRSLKAMGRMARKIAGKKYGYSLMRKFIMEDFIEQGRAK